MKKRFILFVIFSITVLIIGLVSSACSNRATVSHSPNDDVISHTEFSLNTEEVGLETLTRGTIFVREGVTDPDDRRIQISAWVEIDGDDWGGISFNIPQGWEVLSVVSDYPQGDPEPDMCTTVFSTGSGDVTWHRIVEIGVSHLGVPRFPEGTGSVIIELVPESTTEELPDTCSILIGAGSKGDTILNPVHQTYEVPIR